MKKNGIICLVSMFPFLSCSKKCTFCNFALTSARNRIICMWKVSLSTFRKWYCLLCYDLLFRRHYGLKLKNFVKFLLSQHLVNSLIANISWTVAQTPINHIIFWKSVMRTLRCIYLNCFNRLRFLAEVSTKLQKMHFFGQFKGHDLGRKHGN